MEIKIIRVGNNMTNCYLVGDTVIDPGAEGERILKFVGDSKIKQIINTHGHFDHIGGNQILQEKTGAPIVIHESELEFLIDPSKNLSFMMGKAREVSSPPAEKGLKEGEEIIIDDIVFKILHTPGHSPGSIGLYSAAEGILFSGDTIFEMGIGRTDFPGCQEGEIYNSIESKLLVLPEDTKVYPGHGGSTTIGEFRDNIWVRLKG